MCVCVREKERDRMCVCQSERERERVFEAEEYFESSLLTRECEE